MGDGGTTRVTINAVPYGSPLITHHVAVAGVAVVRSPNRSQTSKTNATASAGAAAVQALAAVATSDGVRLAGGGSHGIVRLWDPRTGAAVGSAMAGHAGSVFALAAVPLPDGPILLASGGLDGTVRLWDPRTGAAVGSPVTGHDGSVSALAAVPLPDGPILLASGGFDGTEG